MAIHYVFNAVLIAMRQHSLSRVYPKAAFERITVESLQMFTGIWNIISDSVEKVKVRQPRPLYARDSRLKIRFDILINAMHATSLEYYERTCQ